MEIDLEKENLVQETEWLVDKIRSAKRKLDSFDNSRSNKPQPPAEPIKPKKPSQPLIIELEKPVFLSLSRFIQYSLFIGLPLSFILWIFMVDDYFQIAFLISAIFSILLLCTDYSREIDEFHKKEKINNSRNSIYNEKMKAFKLTFNEYTEKYHQYLSEKQLYLENLKRYQKTRQKYKSTSNLETLTQEWLFLRHELKKLLSLTNGVEDPLLSTKMMLSRHYAADIGTVSKRSVFTHPPYFEEDLKIKYNYTSESKKYINELGDDRKSFILNLLHQVHAIHSLGLNSKEKTEKIKEILWTKQSFKNRLLIGGFIGSIFGLAIFGTGGIGIAALGSAIGIWGWFASAVGGVFISSLIQNFEKLNNN